MRARARTIRIVLISLAALAGAALVLAAPVIWLAIADPFGGAAHPGDRALLAQFAAKRALLEELVDMAAQDRGLARIGRDFTRPEDAAGVPLERLALYRARLAEAGIAEGLRRDGAAIVFLVATRGLAISGSAKGFAYRTGAEPVLARVVEGDLDAAVASLDDKNVLLRRHIAGDWWLELDRR